MSFHFAYGSNMWEEQMRLRCPNHKRVGKGVLKGYRWIISSRGYANVVKSPLDVVFGVVYELTESDEETLDRCEGVDIGSYRKELLSVEVDGLPKSCIVYTDPHEEEGLPKAEYIQRISKGLKDAKLPPGYVKNSICRFIQG